jgi:CheY-like chemotaxis protein
MSMMGLGSLGSFLKGQQTVFEAEDISRHKDFGKGWKKRNVPAAFTVLKFIYEDDYKDAEFSHLPSTLAWTIDEFFYKYLTGEMTLETAKAAILKKAPKLTPEIDGILGDLRALYEKLTGAGSTEVAKRVVDKGPLRFDPEKSTSEPSDARPHFQPESANWIAPLDPADPADVETKGDIHVLTFNGPTTYVQHAGMGNMNEKGHPLFKLTFVGSVDRLQELVKLFNAFSSNIPKMRAALGHVSSPSLGQIRELYEYKAEEFVAAVNKMELPDAAMKSSDQRPDAEAVSRMFEALKGKATPGFAQQMAVVLDGQSNVLPEGTFRVETETNPGQFDTLTLASDEVGLTNLRNSVGRGEVLIMNQAAFTRFVDALPDNLAIAFRKDIIGDAAMGGIFEDRRVLIVQGRALVRKQMTSYFTEAGARVEEAGDSNGAIEVLKKQERPVELVLADLTSIGDPKQADSFAKFVRAASPSTKVLFQAVGSAVNWPSEFSGFPVLVIRDGRAASATIEKATELLSEDLQRDVVRDNAQANGGIDLNAGNMSMSQQGDAAEFRFDPTVVEQFKRGDFTGVTPVILNITPIQSLAPLLGMESGAEEPAKV